MDCGEILENAFNNYIYHVKTWTKRHGFVVGITIYKNV